MVGRRHQEEDVIKSGLIPEGGKSMCKDWRQENCGLSRKLNDYYSWSVVSYICEQEGKGEEEEVEI